MSSADPIQPKPSTSAAKRATPLGTLHAPFSAWRRIHPRDRARLRARAIRHAGLLYAEALPATFAALWPPAVAESPTLSPPRHAGCATPANWAEKSCLPEPRAVGGMANRQLAVV